MAEADFNRVVLVKNLVGSLAKAREKDVKGFMSTFGEVEDVDMEFDGVTGQNRGQAVVHFVRSDDAQAAIRKMNGYVISDTPIIVTRAPYYMAGGMNRDGGDDNKRGFNSSVNRALLAGKLAGLENEKAPDQKKDGDDVDILEKKIKRDICYSRDETRVLGLFNLIDKERLKSQEISYVDDIVKDVKSRITRRMRKLR